MNQNENQFLRSLLSPRSTTSVATGWNASWGKAASVGSTWPTTTSCSGRSPIKVPHRRLVSRPEDAEAYLTEARTVASLDHPNIVPVYDVGSTEDCPCFVVSKFIEGSTLAQRHQGEPAFRGGSGGTGGDGGRGAALRPPAGARPSGRQAGQHPARQERQAVCGRLRAGLARAGRRQGATLRRDARLHESRTGPRRGASGRWPLGHLQPGRGLLRVADRTRPFRGDSREELLEQITNGSKPVRPGKWTTTSRRNWNGSA